VGIFQSVDVLQLQDIYIVLYFPSIEAIENVCIDGKKVCGHFSCEKLHYGEFVLTGKVYCEEEEALYRGRSDICCC